MMTKKIANILKYILIGCFLVCFFPVLVYADAPTYKVLEAGCYPYLYRGGNGGYFSYYITGSDVRAVILNRDGNNLGGGYLFLVSKSAWNYRAQTNREPANACSVDTQAVYPMTYNGETYYLQREQIWTGFDSNTENIPVVAVESGENSASNGIYYTFGAGAVEPENPIVWGLLRDTQYTTRIAGQGLAAKRNIDYLSWNNEVDANGNDISECNVHIKAVLGSWSDTTAEGLLNKTYNDFNIGNYTAVDLGTVSASSGTYSVSWERIINEAGWNFDSLYSHLEDNIFLKQGWYYQICLVDPGGIEHQYQTLYTPLSSSAAASETVINHNSFDTSIYQVYQELSTINNNTSITINIEGTDYTVTNPDDGDEPSGGTDLWDILKQMLNGIFQIIKNIAALPGKFLEMIQQLITSPDQISEEIDTNFNNNMDVLEESQPGIVESMNAVEDLQDTLNESVNSFNGVPECIFTWDAVTMDLSAFNAGTVTFIAAGSFDFAASFMQMINGFGMTYSEYQFYVSAIIYAWILVFIYRHVYAFLAGTRED